MYIGNKITELRKQHNLSQTELAKKIGLHVPVIAKYKRNEVKPSIEVATKITDALKVSLYYLVGHSDLLLEHNILDRVLNIQKLSDKDQEHLFAMMDAFIRDAKTIQAHAG